MMKYFWGIYRGLVLEFWAALGFAGSMCIVLVLMSCWARNKAIISEFLAKLYFAMGLVL